MKFLNWFLLFIGLLSGFNISQAADSITASYNYERNIFDNDLSTKVIAKYLAKTQLLKKVASSMQSDSEILKNADEISQLVAINHLTTSALVNEVNEENSYTATFESEIDLDALISKTELLLVQEELIYELKVSYNKVFNAFLEINKLAALSSSDLDKQVEYGNLVKSLILFDSVNRGVTQYYKAQYLESIATFNYVISKMQHDSFAYNYLGLNYYKLGKYRESESYFKKAIAHSKLVGKFHYNIAKIYADNNRIQDAIAELKLSLKVDPLYTKSYFLLASLYDNIKQKQFVINLYEKNFTGSVKQNLTVSQNIDLADLYVLADKTLSAIKYYKKAAEKLEVNYRLDTSNTLLMMRVISLYNIVAEEFINLDKLNDAKKMLDKSLAIYLQQSQAYYLLGQIDAANSLNKLASEKYNLAIDYFNEDSRLNSGNFQSNYYIGEIFASKKQYAKAIEYYNNANKLDPDDYKIQYSLGLAYYHERKYRDALFFLNKLRLVSESNKFGYAAYYIGRIYYDTEAYDKALSILQKFVKAYPKFALGHLYLAKSATVLLKYELAEDAYQAYLRINPNDASVHFALGSLYDEYGKTKEALQSYDKAKKLGFEDVDLKISQAKAKEKTGQIEQAISLYQQILVLYPRQVDVLANLGVLYAKTNQPEEAIASINTAISINREDGELYYYLSTAYLEINLFDKALGAAKKAYKLKYKHEDVFTNMGRAHYELGQYKLAMIAYDESLKIKKNPEAYYYLGLVCNNLAKWQCAVDNFKKSLELRVGNPALHYHLGIAYYMANKNIEAIDSFKQAIRLKPDNLTRVYYYLGLAYTQNDEIDKALAVHKQVADLDDKFIENYYELANHSFNIVWVLL